MVTNISLLVVGRHATAASGDRAAVRGAFQFAAGGRRRGRSPANPLAKIDRDGRHMRARWYSASKRIEIGRRCERCVFANASRPVRASWRLGRSRRETVKRRHPRFALRAAPAVVVERRARVPMRSMRENGRAPRRTAGDDDDPATRIRVSASYGEPMRRIVYEIDRRVGVRRVRGRDARVGRRCRPRSGRARARGGDAAEAPRRSIAARVAPCASASLRRVVHAASRAASPLTSFCAGPVNRVMPPPRPPAPRPRPLPPRPSARARRARGLDRPADAALRRVCARARRCVRVDATDAPRTLFASSSSSSPPRCSGTDARRRDRRAARTFAGCVLARARARFATDAPCPKLTVRLDDDRKSA